MPRRELNNLSLYQEFLRTVFLDDEMRQFILLSQLDENKEYNVRVEVHFTDWQFGSSDHAQSSDFKLKDVPLEEVKNLPPDVDITSPADNSQFTTNSTISFSANITDPEDKSITDDKIVWSSNLQGVLFNGASKSYKGLTKGRHTIRCTTTDAGGMSNYDQVTLLISEIPDQKPSVQITYPPDGAIFNQGQSINFTGNVTDPEDGVLTGNSLHWSSD